MGNRASNFFQFRIMGPPDPVSGPDAGEVDGVVGKLELEPSFLLRVDVIHASTFFGFLRTTPVRGIKDQAVASLERRQLLRGIGFYNHRVVAHLNNAPYPDTAVPRRAPRHDSLMVGAT